MWFGTTSGLCRYDGYNFKVYKNIKGDESSMRKNSISSLFIDKDGILWIGTSGYLQKYNQDNDNFTHYPLDSLFKGHINGIAEDNLGLLWISNNRDRLVIFDKVKQELRLARIKEETNRLERERQEAVIEEEKINKELQHWRKLALDAHHMIGILEDQLKGCRKRSKFAFSDKLKLPANMKNRYIEK